MNLLKKHIANSILTLGLATLTDTTAYADPITYTHGKVTFYQCNTGWSDSQIFSGFTLSSMDGSNYTGNIDGLVEFAKQAQIDNPTWNWSGNLANIPTSGAVKTFVSPTHWN